MSAKFSEKYLQRFYKGPGLGELLARLRHIDQLIAEADAAQPVQTVLYDAGLKEYAVFTYEGTTAALPQSLSKCTECGLDGNHDTWCPHWAPYVAAQS